MKVDQSLMPDVDLIPGISQFFVWRVRRTDIRHPSLAQKTEAGEITQSNRTLLSLVLDSVTFELNLLRRKPSNQKIRQGRPRVGQQDTQKSLFPNGI